MNRAESLSQVTKFFDEFVEAFKSFDGTEIAKRYEVPYVALQSTGAIECFSERSQVAQYFQRVVSAYHVEGCRSCRYKELTVEPLGRQCMLGTVTWELLKDDQTVLSSWRESYNLVHVGGELRVFASVDHVL